MASGHRGREQLPYFSDDPDDDDQIEEAAAELRHLAQIEPDVWWRTLYGRPSGPAVSCSR